jgi:pimeloyl-ACP methyl ester carboxylesterase
VLAAVLLGSAFTVPDGGNPIFKLPVFILNCFRQKMSDAFLEKGLSPNCSPAVRQLCIQNSGKNDMNIVKAFYQQFRWATLSDWESLLAINTLVVHGDDDKILLPDNAERLVSFLKEKRSSSSQFKYATIVDCAHQIMMEKPDELRAIIAEFVAKIGI